VLVAGSGNSGAEIATDLVEHGAEVYWSFRTAPNIVPRSVLGVATQALGIVLRPMSASVVDPIVATFERATVGDLSRFGVPRPTRGAYTAVLRDRVLPILDVGVVGAIKSGKLKPVAGISSFDASAVVLEGGNRLTPDAVIACTGFRPALESMLGQLGVLDASGLPLVHGPAQHAGAPGLFFLGYTNAISGNLREIAQHARQLRKTLSPSNARA
jgi:cation diffusion facilitator CzcD-associated flavoprotein CzcO